MAFTFDAKAALAKVSEATPHPATPATPATVLPSDAPVAGTVAGIATVAGVGSRAEKTQAAETPSAADLDAFEERAAIAEHDGGASRGEAERMAAEALGFAEPAALFAAAADGWRWNLEALAATLSPELAADARGRECIAAALRFIADGWAEEAAVLGWPEIELFGADPRAPWERLDRMGAAYSIFTPTEVTRDCIGLRGGPRLRRGAQAEGARLPWEGMP